MTIKGIIFDLDGTLVDTLDDLTDAMNAALAQCGCPSRTAAECRQMIGSGLRKYAQRALPNDKQYLIDDLLAEMVADYYGRCLNKTAPYEGIRELLSTLAEKGIRRAVLTNKNQKPAEKIVRHFFGENLFDPVIGAAQGRNAKPDPTTTWEVIKGWDLKPNEVLYVGDSDVDIETARNAQIQCVGCLWGFRSQEQLKAAGADTLIRQPSQILDFLDNQ